MLIQAQYTAIRRQQNDYLNKYLTVNYMYSGLSSQQWHYQPIEFFIQFLLNLLTNKQSIITNLGILMPAKGPTKVLGVLHVTISRMGSISDKWPQFQMFSKLI